MLKIIRNHLLLLMSRFCMEYFRASNRLNEVKTRTTYYINDFYSPGNLFGRSKIFFSSYSPKTPVGCIEMIC